MKNNPNNILLQEKFQAKFFVLFEIFPAIRYCSSDWFSFYFIYDCRFIWILFMANSSNKCKIVFFKLLGPFLQNASFWGYNIFSGLLLIQSTQFYQWQLECKWFMFLMKSFSLFPTVARVNESVFFLFPQHSLLKGQIPSTHLCSLSIQAILEKMKSHIKINQEKFVATLYLLLKC